MRKSVLSAAIASAFILAATPVWAIEGVNALEARAMLEKAIAELKYDEAGALAKFNRRDRGFVDRDLFVFCYDTKDGKFTAHLNKSLLGRDIRTVKDGEGEPVGQRLFDTNKAGTISTIDYKEPRPGTSNPVPRRDFITVVGNQGCGAGYFK